MRKSQPSSGAIDAGCPMRKFWRSVGLLPPRSPLGPRSCPRQPPSTPLRPLSMNSSPLQGVAAGLFSPRSPPPRVLLQRLSPSTIVVISPSGFPGPRVRPTREPQGSAAVEDPTVMKGLGSNRRGKGTSFECSPPSLFRSHRHCQISMRDA
ncbi:hypothetical protein EV356DRAFT_548 [Viridothelium virens]|uniref:Uncharacterized protein n=1 Tax=Viridothelium virens TaxID=1048519 RepID=A0A6A6HP69_VIRVR|nr:hypothetical protein EV356DRAFT_548 [Viridothelium virens]